MKRPSDVSIKKTLKSAIEHLKSGSPKYCGCESCKVAIRLERLMRKL